MRICFGIFYNEFNGRRHKVTRNEVKDPKKRILMVCVRMFIEKGFKATTMLDIIREADVSSGTFQNIFKTKDGVLFELISFMFDNQFAMARGIGADKFPPVYVYAMETAIQLAITELNENIREIYVEVYSVPHLAEYIYGKTAAELVRIFKSYNPDWSDSDFYECEIGSAGMMRAFMAHPGDVYFTLQKKVKRFLEMSLSVYNVPKEEQREIFGMLESFDMVKTAKSVLDKLFAALEMNFNFKFNS